MNDNENDNNIIPFGKIQGGKKTEEEEGIPENHYVLTDLDGEEFDAEGFLIFTPHHCAIMKDFGRGAVPVLVLPLGRVKAAEMVEDVID